MNIATGETLSVRGLVAGFGSVPFVRELSFDVGAGKIFALLGANGAGKTTTLMAIAGFLKPDAGEVRIGEEIQRGSMDRRARQGVAVVTQERCVFMDLSVRDNLRLGRGELDHALELFPELKPHLARKVGLLSGGQQQMLAVSRALAGRPKVLLADELSLGLAPMVVDRLLEAIRGACTAQNTAVVLVEQHLNQALEHADNGAVMHRGQIIITGSALELRARSSEIVEAYL